MPPRPVDPRQIVLADVEARFRTLRGEDVEGAWAALRRLHEQGELREGEGVVPHCPACRATVAARDVVKRPARATSVLVRFPVVEDGGPLQRGDDLLVASAAPWTLVANAAVAAEPERTYVRAKTAPLDPPVVLAEAAVERVLGDAKVLERFPGAAIDGVRYEPPFPYLPARQHGERAHSVLLDDAAERDPVTGLLPVAVAFGAHELRLGRRSGLEPVNPVRPDGTFDERVGKYARRAVCAAAGDLVEDLRARRKLFRADERDGEVPSCGRCGSAVLPALKRAWFAAGEAVSREGGGPPLPVWTCPAGHVACVGSLAELEELSAVRLAAGDAPAVAQVSFPCPSCSRRMTRVPLAVDPGAGREEPLPAEPSLPGDLDRWTLLTGGDEGARVVERLRGAAAAAAEGEGAEAGGDAALLALLADAADAVTDHLAAGDAAAAARALAALAEAVPAATATASPAAARECLAVAARLLAPFMPAAAAELHGRVAGPSVRLDAWPDGRSLRDAGAIVAAVRRAREQAGLRGGERIALTLGGDAGLLRAARAHEALVAAGTSAAHLSYSANGHGEPARVDGRELRIALARV